MFWVCFSSCLCTKSDVILLNCCTGTGLCVYVIASFYLFCCCCVVVVCVKCSQWQLNLSLCGTFSDQLVNTPVVSFSLLSVTLCHHFVCCLSYSRHHNISLYACWISHKITAQFHQCDIYYLVCYDMLVLMSQLSKIVLCLFSKKKIIFVFMH